MSRLFSIPAWSLLLGASALAQTQSFNVGQWFYGKNITSDLPAGVTDLTDNMWGSEGHTCPIVLVGGKASLVCRDNVAGGPFNTVVTEGDARLGNGGRLAIPTTFTSGPNGASPYGRYISSSVRPGPTNLYFTTVVTVAGQTPPFNHITAFRYQNYQTLQRVAGAGDAVTINQVNQAGSPVLKGTLTAAGPMDQNSDGREFIYIEAATGSATTANFYALCELISPGVFNALYVGRQTQTMIDTPWGMGGFTFDHTKDHGGLVFVQGSPESVVDRIDLNIQGGPNPYPIAVQGCLCPVFPPPPQTFVPNLLLSAFFRTSVDMNSFYMSWGNIPSGTSLNVLTPPEFLQQGISPLPSGTGPPGNGWTPIYQSAVGTPQETTLGTFAASGSLMLAGVAPFANATNALQKGGAPWPIQSLLYYTGGAWTSLLAKTALPDASTSSAKAFYQGVTAHGCQVEFATKSDIGAIDGSGVFYGMYRLFRPCLTSATLNTATRQLVVQGVNLADQSTAVYLVVPGSTTMQGPFTVTSATATEVDATVSSFTNGSQVVIVVDGAVQSDPINLALTVPAPPNIADLTDVNFQHSLPVALKLMTLWGEFHCVTAATQTVNYPSTLGFCTVNLENNTPVPLLYTSDTQINLLLPGGLSLGSHMLTVTRMDANGSFTSGPFQFNVFADGPVVFMSNGNVIGAVVRNGQWTPLGPTDPVHPGEYFIFFVTGANVASLPTSVTVGGVTTQFADAFVSWAQGLLQVNVLIPPGTSANPSVVFGNAPPFNIVVQ
jgi:uncharacterized protein (TIGR03437 family)